MVLWCTLSYLIPFFGRVQTLLVILTFFLYFRCSLSHRGAEAAAAATAGSRKGKRELFNNSQKLVVSREQISMTPLLILLLLQLLNVLRAVRRGGMNNQNKNKIRISRSGKEVVYKKHVPYSTLQSQTKPKGRGREIHKTL